MRRKFAVKPLVFSVLFAAAGMGLCLYLADWGHSDEWTAPIWGALAFALPLALGLLGLELGVRLDRRRYNIPRPSLLGGVLLALVVGGVLGAGSQLGFMPEYQSYTFTTTKDPEYDGVHAVVLMDGSGSMLPRREACVQAACLLVDGLDEDSSLQFIAFANNVMPRNVSEFLPMTGENRAALREFIQGVDLAGGTDFNQPLALALETLEENAENRRRSVILMLTDGEAELSDEVARALESRREQVDLYTVRITDDSSQSPQVRALVSLAAGDFVITPDRDGDVDMDEVLDAFLAAVNDGKTVEHRRQRFGVGDELMLLSGEEAYWWRILARCVGCALYAAATGLIYYRRPGRNLLVHLGLGAGAGGLLFLHPWPGLAVLVLICLGAYTTYEIGGEGHV